MVIKYRYFGALTEDAPVGELESNALIVVEDRDTTTEKDERWMDLRTKIVAGQVELSPDPVLRSDLLSARKRYTANGIKVDLPLTRDGRHADYAPALNLAVAKAASGPGWADLLTDWKSRGGATVY